MTTSIRLAVLRDGRPGDPIELQYTVDGHCTIHLVALSFGPLWCILRRMGVPSTNWGSTELTSKFGKLEGIGEELYLLAMAANQWKADFGVEEWLPTCGPETQPGPGRSSAQRTREVV